MSRISDKLLAGLCNRWSISEASGIDVRRSWQRETQGAPRRQRAAYERIRDGVAQGETVSDAVAATGKFFPPLFVALVAVGDETGKLPDVLRRLAAHYENRVKLKREFVAAITGPVLQLTAAVVIVGLLIWLLGVIGSVTGNKPVDVLGFGLIGNHGVAIYATIVLGVLACGYGVYRVLRSDLAWTSGLQTSGLQWILMRVPLLGKTLETMAISRLAWSLGLALEAGMEIKQAVRLAFDAEKNAVFSRHADFVVAQIAAGDDLTMALATTGMFSTEFMTTIEVGELSGNLPETLLRLSDQYQEKAKAALSALTRVAGFIVWGLVTALIVTMIFRIYSQAYLQPINDALERTR